MSAFALGCIVGAVALAVIVWAATRRYFRGIQRGFGRAFDW